MPAINTLRRTEPRTVPEFQEWLLLLITLLQRFVQRRGRTRHAELLYDCLRMLPFHAYNVGLRRLPKPPNHALKKLDPSDYNNSLRILDGSVPDCVPILKYLRSCLPLCTEVMGTQQAPSAQQASVPERSRRPCYDRDQTFLSWKRQGTTPAAIRDRWNKEHPDKPISIETVKKGIKAAERDLRTTGEN